VTDPSPAGQKLQGAAAEILTLIRDGNTAKAFQKISPPE
jgi:hypothetical protein